MIFNYDFEFRLIQIIAEHYGYKNAVRIQDFSMVITSFVLGWFLGMVFLTNLWKSNMFTERGMRNVVYQVNECGNHKEISFKNPNSFMERIQLIVSLHYLKLKPSSKSIKTNKAKMYSVFFLLVIFVLIISLFISFFCMINVVEISDLNKLK